MGHLVNPSALRVGKFSYWEDYWYIDAIYYPEFLHLVLKIRFFLEYFFELSFIELTGFLYSHFCIVKNYKSFIIRVFFVNGIIEEAIDEFLFECNGIFFWHELSLDMIRPVRLLMLLNYLFKFYLVSWKDVNFNGFLDFIKNFNYIELKKLILNEDEEKFLEIFFARSKLKDEFLTFLKKYKKRDKLLHEELKNFRIVGDKIRFLFFYFIFSKLIEIINEDEIEEYKLIGLGGSKKNVSTFFFDDYYFIKFLFIELWFGRFFNILDKFLSGFWKSIALCNFSCNFFILRNEKVTAKFLSRYFAKKLHQGYSLTKLVDPIKFELKKFVINIDILKERSRHFIGMHDASRLDVFAKGLFMRLLSFLISVYRIEFSKFYISNFSWLNFDSFILFRWMCKNLSKINELIGLSCFYFLYRGGFVFFFDNDSYLMHNFFTVNKNLDILLPLKNIKNLNYCYNCIYNSLYAFNMVFFSYLSNISYNIPYLKISIFFFNNFLKYNMWLSSYISKCNIYLDFKQKRIEKILQDSTFGLFGFCFQFKGRFTRKQKASCVVYKVGKVPLTTLNAALDFGFCTIPLKNSAASVKVWIYRNNFFNDIDPFVKDKFFKWNKIQVN